MQKCRWYKMPDQGWGNGSHFMVNEEALFLLIEGLYSILVHCKMTPFSSSSVRLYYAVWPGGPYPRHFCNLACPRASSWLGWIVKTDNGLVSPRDVQRCPLIRSLDTRRWPPGDTNVKGSILLSKLRRSTRHVKRTAHYAGVLFGTQLSFIWGQNELQCNENAILSHAIWFPLQVVKLHVSIKTFLDMSCVHYPCLCLVKLWMSRHYETNHTVISLKVCPRSTNSYGMGMRFKRTFPPDGEGERIASGGPIFSHAGTGTAELLSLLEIFFAVLEQ